MVWVYVVLLAGQFDTSFREGLIALNQGNLPLAQSRLEACAQLQPQNARVWLGLAQTYWKENKQPEAETAAHKAETLGSTDLVVLHSLSIFYSESAHYPDAARVLQAAIARNPADEGYYFELAQLCLKQQDFAASLKALDAGRKRFDQSPQLELASGVAYYGLRRFPEAIDAFLRTIALDEAIEQPYVFLGRMLDQAEGRLPGITQVFAAFAKRAPQSYLSNFLYGKSLAMAGDAAGAEPLLRKSVALNDGYWESHFELGVLLEDQKKLEEAAREVQRSAELNPKEAAPHYHLARLYDRLGRNSDAVAEREVHARLTAAGQAAGIK